ncbi:twin-arginine translocase TatA/TatE family subunit [Psychromonas sp. 14N.309.X.WAT.B.A12]|jgi:sec-independent protein translocase protein TatA|uniref:twin-arginine translocase TatA/TatE family subunit n=1 Tax=unclassified Psychromonas TaxID=2614957 RepID=UPI0025B163B1|nr:twin-arginine translocase TatA/TatE family subunit [Psychromonas sp. 14N.309.X.WAT.B.A12]MDN2664653.1 twin-arginine translocase TatA/TatE family subunit [Psychromonas sp. 14N.309.X.WAT.B.A12]
MGGIGIWQLVIIAVIVIVLFGTKKLRGIGGDLGGAIKGFKKAIKDEDNATELDKKSPESLKAEKSEQKD